MWVKLAGGDLPGSITVMEDLTPPRHGPPLHAHLFEEWFYILEGSFLFELAGIPFGVSVGDFVHAPSNEPHVFQNTSDKDARMLVIAKPGGLENYFAEMAERAMNDPANVAAPLRDWRALWCYAVGSANCRTTLTFKPALSGSAPQPLHLRRSRR